MRASPSKRSSRGWPPRPFGSGCLHLDVEPGVALAVLAAGEGFSFELVLPVAFAAGAVILGGHTVRDAEIKFGYAVTGTIHPDHIITNASARPGDKLVLTKAVSAVRLCRETNCDWNVKWFRPVPLRLRCSARLMSEVNS